MRYLFFILFVCQISLAQEVEKTEETFRLKYNGVTEAIIDTSFSPAFYIPAGIALVTYFDGIGKRISNDSRIQHPLWGNPDRAADASDTLRTVTSISMVSSSLLFHKNGAQYMAYNLAFDILASFSAVQVRGAIRDDTPRSRPNGESGSFPSGHATAVGARVALSNYNIFRSDLDKNTKYWLAGMNWSVAYLTAYSRIESHNHYTEDVMAGIALGYWVTNVMKKTFTNTYMPLNFDVAAFGGKDDFGLLVEYRF
jgi:hypothetical protein